MNLKLFGKNAFFYLLGNLCVRSAGFVLIPLYTHSLSVPDFGVLATLLITIQMITLLMGMATDKGFLRFASEYDENGYLGSLLGTTLVINGAGALVVTSLCLLLAPLFKRIMNTPDMNAYVLLACAAGFTQALFDRTAVYFRAKNEGVKFLIATVPTLLLLVVANLIYLSILRQGVKGALHALILAYGTVWIAVFVVLVRKIDLSCSFDIGKRLLRFSLPFVSVQSTALLLDMSAIYFLGYFAGQEQVAIYSLGYKIAQIAVMVVILPFQLAYEPFIYANLGNSQIRSIISRLLTYVLLAYAVVASALAFLTRPMLAVIAPPQYFAAYKVVLYMLPAIGFIGVYYVAESLLGIAQRSWFIGAAITFFTLLALSLYYSLIPVWGIYGAIAVFSFVRMMSAVVSMAAGMRLIPLRIEYSRVFAAGGAFLLLLSLIYLLFRSPSYIYYTVVPCVGVMTSAFLYCSALVSDSERSRIRVLVGAIHPKLKKWQVGAH